MIKVTNVEGNKRARSFPCLLMGCSSKNYYYAKDEFNGFNLTSGDSVCFKYDAIITFSTNHFDDVQKIELSYE